MEKVNLPKTRIFDRTKSRIVELQYFEGNLLIKRAIIYKVVKVFGRK
jgi:hypothetical protein